LSVTIKSNKHKKKLFIFTLLFHLNFNLFIYIFWPKKIRRLFMRDSNISKFFDQWISSWQMRIDTPLVLSKQFNITSNQVNKFSALFAIWIAAIASSYRVYSKVPFRLIGPRISYDPDNPRNPTSVKASGLIYTKQELKKILCCLLAPLIPRITLRDGQIIFFAQKFDSTVFNFWSLFVNSKSFLFSSPRAKCSN